MESEERELMDDYLALGGVAGLALGGRPMRTLRSFSIVPEGYRASLVIGFIFAVCRRFSTASFVMHNALAISVNVSPVIDYIIGVKLTNKKSFLNFGNFTKRMFSGFSRKIKNIRICGDFLLIKYPNTRILNI
jgi:hypothetical protein